MRKYWEIADKKTETGQPQFFTKNGILCRKFCDKNDYELVQLMVLVSLREKAVSLARDTLLGGHRAAAETLARVVQEFFWPGIHSYVSRYSASCDLCQCNISNGTVPKSPLGKLPLVDTPFSVMCVDIIGPISPPSDGYRYILTTTDMCTRFPEAIPLKDIETSTIAEALYNVPALLLIFLHYMPRLALRGKAGSREVGSVSLA